MTISYTLSDPVHVTLAVYDIHGRNIIVLDEGYRVVGEHCIIFNAENLECGVYFAKLETAHASSSRRMINRRFYRDEYAVSGKFPEWLEIKIPLLARRLI